MDALLVIDVQQVLITGAYRETEVLEVINVAIERIRRRQGVIVYVQHCHASFEPMKKGSPGWQLHHALAVQPDDVIVEKTASDAFYQTNLDRLLRERGVDHVYIAGLQTEFCVDASCRSALSKDYSVTLISDGHTTGDSHLTADKIVDHHNQILCNLAHPTHQINLAKGAEV